MKTIFLFGLMIVLLLSVSCSSVKLTLNSVNTSDSPMIVDIESRNNKGTLKVNTSFLSEGKGDFEYETTPYIVEAYKGGVVKLTYRPQNSETSFNLSEIEVPKSNRDFEKTILLSEVKSYNEENEKQKLLQLAKNLQLDKTKNFVRLVDIKKQLGTLVIGKYEDTVLTIKDFYNLTEEDIVYDEPLTSKSSAITTKNIMANVSLSVPVFGSVESKFSNDYLHQIMWEIKHYNYSSTFNVAQYIISLSKDDKNDLVNALRIVSDQDIFILRNFNIIESGSFTATKATKIQTSADAAVASVFNANGAYTFKADDNEFVTLASQTYNLEYSKFMSVNDLINNLDSGILKEELLLEKLITPSEIKQN